MALANRDGQEYYIDGRLKENLDEVIRRIKTKDEDYFFVVDGEEGAGKSVFALQLAKYLDESFCLERVVFDGKSFREAIKKAKKGQAVVFDEAFRGLSSRGALSEINRLLVSLMMECRQKNLMVILVLPTFFLLDKYAALWRAKGLFHIYRRRVKNKNGWSTPKRGFWVFYNKRRKKILYLKGKSTYNYNVFKKPSNFRGRFTNHYTIDEAAYRAKKAQAFKHTNRNTRTEAFHEERNLLLWIINRELGLSTTQISQRVGELGWDIAQNSVSEAIVKQERLLVKRGKLQK